MPDPRPARHDPDARRFVLDLDEGEAYLQYGEHDPQTVEFSYTFVPPEARGRGIAARLVHQAVAWAHTEGRTVVPTCGYVRSVMARDGLPTSPPASGRPGPPNRLPA